MIGKTVLIILTLLFFSIVFPIDLFFKIIGMGFFKSYSNAKTIWFLIILLITFIAINIKQKIELKNLNKIIMFLIGLLILINLFSFIIYSNTNQIPIYSLSSIVFSEKTNEFTINSLTHIHSMKPMISILNFFGKGKYDLGLEFEEFMPNWFSIIYPISLVLFVLFLLLSIIKLINLKKSFSKNLVIPLTWLYSTAVFLVSKSVIDGGMFTQEFLIGIILFTYFFRKNLNNPLKYFLQKLVLLLPVYFLIKILVLQNYSLIIVLTHVLINLVSILGTIVFIFTIYLLIQLIQVKNFKKTGLLITYFLIMVFLVNLFSPMQFSKNFFELNEKIPKNEEFLIAEKAISDFNKLIIIDSTNELLLVKAKQDTSINELVKWKNNLKANSYVFRLKPNCGLFIHKQVRVRTKDLVKSNPVSSIFLKPKLIPCENDCDYLLDYYENTCITDSRFALTELLKKFGLKNFIVYF